MAIAADEVPEKTDREAGAGQRSNHGSSADAWEERDRVGAGQYPVPAINTADRRLARTPVIEPLVLAERAKAMEAAYLALCDAVLIPSDYAWYVVKTQLVKDGMVTNVESLEQRKRKSAWRKLARYFNLDLVIAKEVIGHRHVEATCSRIVLGKHGLTMAEGEDCGCPTVYARYHGQVVAPNGRVGFGVGIASVNERSFKAQDHSVPATAWTRMISRAVSDLIGAGDSSVDDPAATEDAPKGEPVAREALTEAALTPQQTTAYAKAWKAATEDRRRIARKLLSDHGLEQGFVAKGAAIYQDVMAALGAVESDTAPGTEAPIAGLGEPAPAVQS